MNPVVGGCGKHPGQSMINCPLCEIEKMKSTTMTKRYKLLKDLPDYKAGIVYRWEEGIGQYVHSMKGVGFNKEHVENNPEWFEEIPEPTPVTDQPPQTEVKDLRRRNAYFGWNKNAYYIYSFQTNQPIDSKLEALRGVIEGEVNGGDLDIYKAVSYLETNGWVCMKHKEYYVQKEKFEKMAFYAARAMMSGGEAHTCENKNFIYQTSEDYIAVRDKEKLHPTLRQKHGQTGNGWEIVSIEEGGEIYNQYSAIFSAAFKTNFTKKIKSVKRLSDNTIWIVDHYADTNNGRGRHKILGFTVIDGDMCVELEGFKTQCEFLSKLEKPTPDSPFQWNDELVKEMCSQIFPDEKGDFSGIIQSFKQSKSPLTNTSDELKDKIVYATPGKDDYDGEKLKKSIQGEPGQFAFNRLTEESDWSSYDRLEKKCLADLTNKFKRDTAEAQRKVSVSVSEFIGTVTLAFYRGIDAAREQYQRQDDKNKVVYAKDDPQNPSYSRQPTTETNPSIHDHPKDIFQQNKMIVPKHPGDKK